MKVLVVGGGPAGLFFGIQMRRAFPSVDLRIVEQNGRDATYGFGIGIQDRAMGRLVGYNAGLFNAIKFRMWPLDGQVITVGDVPVEVDGNLRGGAIARIDMLNILEREASDLGLTVEYDVRVDDDEDFSAYDLIVGADGANSTVRDRFQAEFGTRKTQLKNYFAWYGCRHSFPLPGLVFRHAEAWTLVAHYYSHNAEMASFVAECDQRTWDDEGFGDLTDVERKRVFEEVFAKELGGDELIENRSVWRRWPVISNERWWHDKFVLVGDARRAAHPSIGSGTRLAFDDAQTLFEAIRDTEGTVADKLAAYQRNRGESADALISAMEQSYTWYENVREHMQLPPLDFVHNFMTRTNRVDDDRLCREHPKFMEKYDAYRASAAA